MSIIALLLAAATAPGVGAELAGSGAASVQVFPAEKQPGGVLVHKIRSPYQSGETTVRVLLPDRVDRANRHRALYVLPVEPQGQARYGDGLAEIVKHDLHNRHGMVCVAPGFAQWPWYADHPTDPEIRQETYFLRVVLPLVEREYPVRAEREGRLLLGFSKSGWGAWSLLLRHPAVFERAAAWDAPLMEDRPEKYGMAAVFGTQKHFEGYHLGRLLRDRAKPLGDGPPRLILTGYGNFRRQHAAAHARLEELGIPHTARDGPKRKHDWHSGWVAQAVELLASRP